MSVNATALRLEDQSGACSTKLTPLSPGPDLARRAGIVVCSQARSADEARELLAMLGLFEPPALPQPAPAPPKPRTPDPVRAAKPLAKQPAKQPPAGKLTRPDADAIRRRWAAGGEVTQHQLAAEYGVDQKTISDIVRYVTWTDGSLIIGECVECGRTMITQREFQRNTEWREKGFVRHATGDRCNGCYSTWRKRGGQAQPRFAASNVEIQPYYPVICRKCGPVGEPPTTREAANRIRQAHIQVHRRPRPAETQVQHRAGHALGLAEHVDRGEPLCPPCQALCDTLAAGGHLAPALRTA